MAAYWLGKVCTPSGTMEEGALVVDTDAAGYFREAEKEAFQFCFDQFAARLLLEMALLALIGRGDKS
jgi:hypothetical protein